MNFKFNQRCAFALRVSHLFSDTHSRVSKLNQRRACEEMAILIRGVLVVLERRLELESPLTWDLLHS